MTDEIVLTKDYHKVEYSNPIPITGLESIRNAYLGLYLRPNVTLRLDLSKFPHNTVTDQINGLVSQLQLMYGAVIV